MSKIVQGDWKQPTFDGLCPSLIDWAQMAAFIDGEGSILINPRRGRHAASRYTNLASTFYLKLTIANTDFRLPLWAQRKFGGSCKDANTEKYYEGRNWKRCWHWSCSSHRAAWILTNSLPYFVMKREQAEIGIALQESMFLFTRGHARQLPLEVVELRRELKRRLLVLKSRGLKTEPQQQERIAEVS
jgi:hypothetical protein